MEPKEWPLKLADLPEPDKKFPPKRHAIIVQVVGAENLWAPEPGVEVPPIVPVEEKLPKSSRSPKAGREGKEGKEGREKASSKAVKAGTDIASKVYAETVPEIGGENASEPPVPEKLFSKASVSFRFPGVPDPETGPEICDPVAPEPMPPPPEPPKVLTEADDDLSDSELPPPVPPPERPVNKFATIATKEYDLVSNYGLWNRVVQEHMEITVYWTSPSGAIRKPLGRVKLDLFPALALRGKGDVMEISAKLEKLPEPVVVEEKGKGKKGKKDKVDKETKEKEEKKEKEEGEKPAKAEKKSKKKKKDAAEEAAPEETLPALPEGALLNILLSTTNPFLEEWDRVHGLVMEISIQAVHNLPPKVAEFGSRVGKGEMVDKGKVNKSDKGDKDEKSESKGEKGEKGSKRDKGDPFSYSLIANIPGFSGYWWETAKGLEPEEKAGLSRIKLESGKVEKEVAPLRPERAPSIIPETGTAASFSRQMRKLAEERVEEYLEHQQQVQEKRQRLAKEREKKQELIDKLLCCDQSMPDDDGNSSLATDEPEPTTLPEPTEKVVLKWPEAPVPTVKRFLPWVAAFQLLDEIKAGAKFRGELARYLKPPTDLFDPNFEKYRGCFFLDLSDFLLEGVDQISAQIPFEEFTLAGTGHGVTFCPAPPKPTGKKAPKAVEDYDPLPVSVDPDNPLPNNSWQLCKSVVLVHIRTNRPMTPFWEPPPQPDLSLEQVIPSRVKAQTVYDAVKLATQNFTSFVATAADDLIDMYQTITRESAWNEDSKDDHSLSPRSSKRIETKGEIRKKMVKVLRKSGSWNEMMEEMKVRVLKVAAEKVREKRRTALDVGKFEFCNDLYITLGGVIYDTLKELMEKKRENKEHEPTKDVDRLRSLADEYEATEDYFNAYRCHQERLKGDRMKNANLWFEFGCFCMRVRPKDHGKAEECWREALTLNREHLLSLQALGCLMWHRGYLTQAEVLLRSAIDSQTLEEHISWVIVSQIYAAQGKVDNERACLRRAEDSYEMNRERRNSYSSPHQLLSPLLRFPFSLGYIVHKTRKSSSVFIDAALFLLDVHLPVEAEAIMKLDSDIYSCTLDNKWCKARACELKGDLEGTESWTKEALAITKENAITYLLIGHFRSSFKPSIEIPKDLQLSLYKEAINAYSKYHRYHGVNNDMYQYVYLDMGNAYMKLREYDEARKIFLKACTIKPTCPSFWLAAGLAYYEMGDLKHAELALVEGNVLDVQNFTVWAYLTLVCLRMGRDEEAENAFQQALKTAMDPKLLAIIADHFASVGNFRDAETALIESLTLKEQSSVRFYKAEMHYKTGKFLQAKKDYEIVVKLSDVHAQDHDISISRLVELQDVAETTPLPKYSQKPNYEA